MNTNYERYGNLPLKGNPSLLYIASLLIAILMTIASVAGLRYRTLIYPTDELIQTFVSNDVVNLFIGLPILLGSMWLTWRGKLVGLLCWAGALFFVLYNYIAYVFAMPLNWAFTLHLVLMMICTYTLIGLIAVIDGEAMRQRLAGTVPEKFAGGVLAALGTLLTLRVLGVLVAALTNGTLPAKTELAVNISDFLTTPAWIVGGVLLWKRKELGYVTGLGLLFQGSMLFIGLIIFLLLQPPLTGLPLATTDIFVVFVMGLVCFIPFGLFIRGVMASDSTKQR